MREVEKGDETDIGELYFEDPASEELNVTDSVSAFEMKKKEDAAHF